MNLLSLLPPPVALIATLVGALLIVVLLGRDMLGLATQVDAVLYDVACGCVGFAIGFTLGFTLAGAV